MLGSGVYLQHSANWQLSHRFIVNYQMHGSFRCDVSTIKFQNNHPPQHVLGMRLSIVAVASPTAIEDTDNL